MADHGFTSTSAAARPATITAALAATLGLTVRDPILGQYRANAEYARLAVLGGRHRVEHRSAVSGWPRRTG
jgi:hypothetical protein